MKNILKQNLVKIPKDIHLIYINKKKLLLIMSSIHRKVLKLKVQLFIMESKKTLKVSKLTFLNVAKSNKKNLKMFQKIDVALIKQSLFEISVCLYLKLKLIGVGYRVFNCKNSGYQLLLFKLGYSHFIYFKTLKNLNFLNFKMTKLFVFCNSFQKLTQVLSSIRLLKKPEPYKGKGIRYEAEKINIKKSKKV